MKQFFGKYRGKVENNVDPEQRGRIQVSVPTVLQEGSLSWAMPCLPYGGKSVGFFAIPPVGTSIWVEFEGGDPDYPIWTGCFWATGDAPASPTVAEVKILKTEEGTIELKDVPGAGGIKIETKAGMKIEMTAAGIKIDNGQGATIELAGPKVSINGSALEVI